jgi:hypothetical protein
MKLSIGRVCVVFVIFGLLLLQAPVLVSSDRPHTIGVKEGDSFEFIIEKYYSNNENNNGAFIELDIHHSAYYGEEGDEFVITFNNVAIEHSSYGDEYKIKYDITLLDRTFTAENVLHNFGGYVISIDWEYHKEQVEDWIDGQDPSNYIKYEGNIIDTESEFGYKISYKRDSDLLDAYIENISETRYDKSTGVFNFQTSYFLHRMHGEGEETVTDQIIKRKGYVIQESIDRDEDLILSFGFSTFVYAMIIISIVKLRTKKSGI